MRRTCRTFPITTKNLMRPSHPKGHSYLTEWRLRDLYFFDAYGEGALQAPLTVTDTYQVPNTYSGSAHVMMNQTIDSASIFLSVLSLPLASDGSATCLLTSSVPCSCSFFIDFRLIREEGMIPGDRRDRDERRLNGSAIGDVGYSTPRAA